MTLNCKNFQTGTLLCKFVNDNAIAQNNILKIDADAASGGWILFWWT